MKTKIGRKELLEKAIEFGHLYDAAGMKSIFRKIRRALLKDEAERNKIRRKYGFPEIYQFSTAEDFWFAKGRKTFDVSIRYYRGYSMYKVQDFLNPSLSLFEFEKRMIKRAIHKVEKEIDEDSIKLGRKLARLDKLKNDYGEGI